MPRVTENVQKVLEQAMALPAEDRAELAAQLLATLDDREDEVESAWAAEIQRRASEARERPNEDEDWHSVLDRSSGKCCRGDTGSLLPDVTDPDSRTLPVHNFPCSVVYIRFASHVSVLAVAHV